LYYLNIFIIWFFSSNIKDLGTNAAEPDWGMENHWYYMDVLKAFKTDSSHFTHPIYAEVKDPEEISVNICIYYYIFHFFF